jgi:hypothetical protein
MIEVDPEYLSIFDAQHDVWQLVPGNYTFSAGGSSQSLPLHASVNLK